MASPIFSSTNDSWMLFEEEPVKEQIKDRIKELEKIINAKNLNDEGLKKLAMGFKKMEITSESADEKEKYRNKIKLCVTLKILRERLEVGPYAIFHPGLYRAHLESFQENH